MGAHTAWVAELECIADADIQQYTGIQIVPATDGHVHVIPAAAGSFHGVATRDIPQGFQGAFWPIGTPMDAYVTAIAGSIEAGDPLAINSAGAFQLVAEGLPFDAVATQPLVSGTANQEVLSQIGKAVVGPFQADFVASAPLVKGQPVQLGTAGEVAPYTTGTVIGVALAAASALALVPVAILAPVVSVLAYGVVAIGDPLAADDGQAYAVVAGAATVFQFTAVTAKATGATTTGLVSAVAIGGKTASA